MEESADEHDLEDGKKRDKMEGDRVKAEEMHRTAMDTLGKTQKRKSKVPILFSWLPSFAPAEMFSCR